MPINFERFRFTYIFLFVLLTLNGCVVAVVGALGGATVYVGEEKSSNDEVNKPQVLDTQSKKPDIVKDQNPQVALTEISTTSSFDTTKDQLVLADPKLSQDQIQSQIKENQQSTETSKIKPGDVTSITSIDNLTAHSWKIIGQKHVSAFSFKSDNSVFNFTKRGVFEAFISCNVVSGKIKIDNAGKFFLSNLHSSNDLCPDGRDQEVRIVNHLLLANKFAIYNQTMILSVDDEPLLAFNYTDKIIDLAIPHNYHKRNLRQKLKTRKHIKHPI